MLTHLATFQQEWTDSAGGRALPRFVTAELEGFLGCGIAQKGFAQLYCETCQARHVVAFCCKGRGFCPSCGGRRMNEGAANLVDHVLPEGVAIRQWVLTLPFPLRFPLAFDGKLLGAVLRIFTDTVASWYRKRQAADGGGGGRRDCGGVTVIQRASSDLRLNPHFHTLFLDGVYVRDSERDDHAPPVFHQAPPPSQEEVEAVVYRTAKRVLGFLQKRGVIAAASAPGDGEVTIVGDDTLGETDPLLARLLAAATAGAPPAGPAHRRTPVRLVMDAGTRPQAKGRLCAQHWGFNLHAASRVAANDKQGRETLCRYVLRPPLANDRLHVLSDDQVQLDFKRPWSDGTKSVVMAPLALIARLAAIVPPPKRHVTRYFGVLSSHSGLRSQVVPTAEPVAQPPPTATDAAANDATNRSRKSKYIPWRELLRRTFAIDIKCPRCKSDLRLIALVKTEATIKKILGAMGLPTEPPRPASARAPPSDACGGDYVGEAWLN